ncbi:MAG: NHL domain-containing protein [Bacteroidia bacterium]
MKRHLFFITFIIFFICSEAQIIMTIAGNGVAGYSGNGGSSTSAQLNWPLGIATDMAGNLYIADSENHVIRKVDNSGIITTVAGTGIKGYSGDGSAATLAQLYFPAGVTVDAIGNIYIADDSNNVVRKINTGGIITTVAGNGTQGYSGDGGGATSSQLYGPVSVAVNKSGEIYIADIWNDVVRKVNTSGIITTVAGGGTVFPTNGSATSIQMEGPSGVALDRENNLFISDMCSSAIYKVDSTGMLTIIAGMNGTGFSGDGGIATSAQIYLCEPTMPPITYPGLTIDSLGNIYIADVLNHRIRVVNSLGIINTLAGTGISGYSGDGGISTSARLNYPVGVAVSLNRDIFISDWNNQRIRKITGYSNILSNNVHDLSLDVFPNPTNGNFQLKSQKEIGTISIYNTLGEFILQKNIKENSASIDVSSQPIGIYILRVKNQIIKLIKE